MANRLLLLLFLLTARCVCYAQPDKILIRFLDATTNKPLSSVTIICTSGILVAMGDTSGFAIIPFGLSGSTGKLIAICSGYTPDTLYRLSEIIYLQPLAVTLGGATISSARTRRLFNDPHEYVVDYEFAGDKIIAASYSGNSGKKARLFLLDMTGKPLGQCIVPEEPVSMYKSCLGNCYCVCRDKFFPVDMGSQDLSLRKPYPIYMLAGLQQCERSVDGNQYYRISDRNNFTTTYGMIEKGRTGFVPFRRFEEKDVVKANYNDLMEIYTLLEYGQVNKASQVEARRKMWNNGSYAHIGMPLLLCGDSLALFDYFKKRILFYDLKGEQAGGCDIHFDWPEFQHFNIIEDDATGKIYIHRYANKSKQAIEELDVKRGMVSGKITLLERPLAEQVKVYNGVIYFLWQDSKAGATRQLYTQNMD